MGCVQPKASNKPPVQIEKPQPQPIAQEIAQEQTNKSQQPQQPIQVQKIEQEQIKPFRNGSIVNMNLKDVQKSRKITLMDQKVNEEDIVKRKSLRISLVLDQNDKIPSEVQTQDQFQKQLNSIYEFLQSNENQKYNFTLIQNQPIDEKDFYYQEGEGGCSNVA